MPSWFVVPIIKRSPGPVHSGERARAIDCDHRLIFAGVRILADLTSPLIIHFAPLMLVEALIREIGVPAVEPHQQVIGLQLETLCSAFAVTSRSESYPLIITGARTRLDRGLLPQNWLSAGSLSSEKRAAVIMSLIQPVRLNGHDPYTYLKDVLIPCRRIGRMKLISYCRISRYRPESCIVTAVYAYASDM